VLTAFGGVFEPVANPSFVFHGCNLGGLDLLTAQPPAAPAAAGADDQATLVLPAIGSGFGNVAPIVGINFGQSLGLDTGNLLAPPLVRFTATLDGLSGQALVGAGFSTNTTTSLFDATGTFSTAVLDLLAPFQPASWAVTEAEDRQGALSRTRAVLQPGTSSAASQVVPQLIPTVAGLRPPVANPPVLEVFDAIDLAAVVDLQGNPVTGLLGIDEVVVADAAGRRWLVLAEDADDTAATNLYQFPVAGSQPTLLAGDWQVTARSRLFGQGTGAAADFVLAERLHRERTLARSPALAVTVP
jgi:hypothetical protein